MNPLLVFECASRHESFLAASRELGVTPGAVSRQVKALEDHFGVPLFTRHNRRVVLTADGASYSHAIRGAFSDLRRETASFLGRRNTRSLRIWCSAMVMHWLLPRISRFYEAHPRADIELSINQRPAGQDFDMTIRVGIGNWPGLKAMPLFESAVRPVCSPDYLRRHGPVRGVEGLKNHTLLFSTSQPSNWSDFLAAVGLDVPGDAARVTFGADALAYQAALDGVGIALGRCFFVDDDLRAGRLVSPLDLSGGNTKSYFLVARLEATRRPDYRKFVDWITSEIAQHSSRMAEADGKASVL